MLRNRISGIILNIRPSVSILNSKTQNIEISSCTSTVLDKGNNHRGNEFQVPTENSVKFCRIISDGQSTTTVLEYSCRTTAIRVFIIQGPLRKMAPLIISRSRVTYHTMCDATQMNCLGAIDKQKALQTPNCFPWYLWAFPTYCTKATGYFSNPAMEPQSSLLRKEDPRPFVNTS
jgi:hypothetical protein